jgi:vancomycin permeability regulator SanA
MSTECSDGCTDTAEPAAGRGRRLRRIFLRGGSAAALAVIALTVGSHLWIVYSTRDAVYDDIQRLPANEVGLVLSAIP